MMKLIYSSDDASDSDLDQEALRWVVRLTSGETTSQDHEAFRRWRDSNETNRAALARARRLWQQLGQTLPAVERHTRRRVWRHRWTSRLMIAASLVLAVGLSDRYLSDWRYDQVTAFGEQRTLALPDGSNLTMSGDTALDIAFDNKERRIRIARGKVLLSVRHNAAAPFLVEAGAALYRDVGTVFGVSRDGDTSRLVVEQGLVDAAAGRDVVRLSAGQAVTITGGILGQVAAANHYADLGWARGRFEFSNMRLDDIIKAITPHYSGRILLLSDRSRALRLSASIETSHIDDWLDALSRTRDLGVHQLGGYTIVY